MSSGPVLSQNPDGPRSIRYQGKNYQVPVFTSEQLARKAAAHTSQKKTLIFVPSPLFLDTIAALLTLLPPSVHILCVEADQNLMSFSLAHSSPESIHSDRITYIRTDSPASVSAIIEELGIWRFRRCSMLTFNRVYSLNMEFYSAVHRVLQASIRRYWQNKMTLIRMGSMWIKNLLKNISTMSAALPVTALQITRPVCVIGAGESLEYSLDTLKNLRKHFFLICVDTALPVLRDAGLSPDLIVILETQSVNLKDFIGQQELEIPVAFDLTSHPGAHSIFKGKKYYFLSEFAKCSLISAIRQNFPEVHIAAPLGSVGVTAVYLGALLTSLPVFYTGLDFSYVPGKPHARGAPSLIATLLTADRLSPAGFYGSAMQRDLIQFKDKQGQSRYTDAVLQSYIEPLKAITGNQDRFFDIGRCGLSTGAPCLKGYEEIMEILNTAYQIGQSAPKIAQQAIQDISRDRISRFLYNEQENLLEVVTLGKQIITGTEHNRTQEKFRNKLEDTDYIYAHFPESQPLPFQNIPFIKRIVVSAGHYHSIISNLTGQ